MESSGKRPTIKQEVEFWKSNDFRIPQAHCPAVSTYVKELQKRFVNGRVIFESFLIPDHPVADAILRDPKGMLFFRKFWHAPSPNLKLNDLQVPPNFSNIPPFSEESSFFFAGQLASALYWGGAYYQAQGSGRIEKNLADAVADEWIQDDYSTVKLFTLHEAWTPFFYNVAWDYTWLLIDSRLRYVHVLCATDTD